MGKFFYITLLTCILTSGSAQITITRQSSFGGSASEAYPKIIRSGSSLYIGGTSNSGISFDKTEPTRGTDDYWVLKTDTLHQILWQKTIGGNKMDGIRDMILTSDSSILLLGGSISDSSGEKNSNGYGNGDFWLVKLSDDGTFLWDLAIGGSESDEGIALFELADSTFMIGGTSYSDSSGLRTQYLRGLCDFWLVRLDSQGNVIWDRAYGGNGSDQMWGMSVVQDTMVIMTGISNSSASFEKSNNCYGKWDIWVVCTDLNGNLIWEKTLGGSLYEYCGRSVVYDNSLYIIGSSDSNISGTKTEQSKGESDIWINKIDFNGNIIWDKTIGGNYRDDGNAAIKSNDGNIVISGFSQSGVSGDKTEPNRGWGDYWVVAIDTSGNLLWQKTFGGNMPDNGSSILETRPGSFIVAGTSYSGYDGDKTISLKGESDFWIIEFDVATAIKEYPKEEADIYLFPNPARDYVQLSSLHGAIISDISIINIHGAVIRRYYPKTEVLRINLMDLPPGVYLVETTLSNGHRKNFKLVVQ